MNPEEALVGFIRGGEEHRYRRGVNVYRKATYPGQYGFTVISLNGQPTLTHALPAEYLARLLLSNRLFGDNFQLLGVTRETAGLAILSSQPAIVGDACSREEMTAYFAVRHFSAIPGLSVGNPGALAFYRDLDQTAAFDIHPGNLLRDANGVVTPIDVIVLEADDELAASLEALV